MKRKTMLRALLICAFGGMLLLAAGVQAQAPQSAASDESRTLEDPYWTNQQSLQTDWWTSLTVYHPLFWKLYGWMRGAPAEANSGNDLKCDPRTLPRVCGGEEGFNLVIRW